MCSMGLVSGLSLLPRGGLATTLRRRLSEGLAGLRLLRHWRNATIPTHITSREKLALMRLAREAGGGSYVEVGSYLGASACFIAEGLARCGREGTLCCVDTWTNLAMSEGQADTYARFRRNTRHLGATVVALRGLSAEVARDFEGPVQFLFIDGDHSYEGVSADVAAWFPKLAPGATVVFHDIGWSEGVRRVVAEQVKALPGSEGRLPNLFWARVGPVEVP